MQDNKGQFDDSDFSDVQNSDDPDFSNAFEKRRVKRRIERCFVCKLKINTDELFRPCNCEFGYIHTNCLRIWMQQKTQCRICQHNYDILNVPDSCGICRSMVDDADNVRSCECKFRRHHKNCIQKCADENLMTCPFCMKDYAVQRAVSWRLTSRKLQKAFAAVCKFIIYTGKSLYVLFWAAVFLFLLAPENIIHLRLTFLDAPNSFILFPGNEIFPAWLDTLYLTITLFFLFCSIVFSLIVDMDWTDFKGLWLMAPGIIPGPILFHLLGNIHIQFYCKCQVIPHRNCYWMANFNSILVGISFLYPPIIFYLIFLCFRQIFCKRIVTNTVLDLQNSV